MLMLLDIAITGGVNLRPNFSPGVLFYNYFIQNLRKIVEFNCSHSVAIYVSIFYNIH